MDDRIGTKKSSDLVRRLLLGYRTGWIGGLLLLYLLILSESSSAQTSSDTSLQKYPCDTTQQGKIKCAEWYSDSSLHIVKKYKDGIRHGVWIYYHKDGELNKKVKYRKGEIIHQLFFKENKLWKTIDKRGKVRYKMDCDCL